MSKNYDVIVIGAGSIGVPATMNLAYNRKKVLCIDSFASPGQGNNKKAIGGVRATHSDFGKITVCQRSIEIFSTWAAKHGDDIGWISNSYCFPAFDEATEKTLKDTLKIQKSFNLNIGWLNPDEIEELVPGLRKDALRGGTFSPDDGSCSPLRAINAFYFKSLEYGAEYRFSEKVIDIKYSKKAFAIKTDKADYTCDFLINAAGNYARDISHLAGFECHVTPDSHEAAITDPVQRFFEPMVVDTIPAPGSKNYYFYQNNEGQVVFCITPEPLKYGIDNDTTSSFLPLCVTRMLQIYPRLKNLNVRRQWRGQYPMTPDGSPIVGKLKENPFFIQAVGMCGQGFMMGPGIGEILNRIVEDRLTADDQRVLESFNPYRNFDKEEMFK
ncbi:MAG: FAD-binding oxidoreductase [Candidatus Cloacimonetes bacterium]|nr:FAD-binding oxidoreductase [Candidatus Cloacimonadota bacterium]